VLALALALAIPTAAAEAGFTQLVLDEEFDGSKEDVLNRWALGLWYHGGRLTPAQLKVARSIATLTAQPAPKLRNAMLSSWGHQTFRFGYFEARMRWPQTHGNWANFWLESTVPAREPYHGAWPPYCEIDIMEALPRGYQATVHEWTGRLKETAFTRQNYRRVIGIDTTRWHTYAALWTPKTINFYLDGESVLTSLTPTVCAEQEMMINFGIQRRTGFSESADVDWVRVWH
jgi:beta-glucanase (GH16 family)